MEIKVLCTTPYKANGLASNEFEFLLFKNVYLFPNKLVNGFAVASESHASTPLPTFAPQIWLSHSESRTATGIIQTRWA